MDQISTISFSYYIFEIIDTIGFNVDRHWLKLHFKTVKYCDTIYAHKYYWNIHNIIVSMKFKMFPSTKCWNIFEKWTKFIFIICDLRKNWNMLIDNCKFVCSFFFFSQIETFRIDGELCKKIPIQLKWKCR